MTYNLDERSTKVLFSQRVKGKVRDWFHSRPAHLQSDMAELLGKMDRMFNRRPDKMRLHEDFVKRNAAFTPRRTRTKTLFANVFICSCRVHTAAKRTKRSHTIRTLSFVHVCSGMDAARTNENVRKQCFCSCSPWCKRGISGNEMNLLRITSTRKQR